MRGPCGRYVVVTLVASIALTHCSDEFSHGDAYPLVKVNEGWVKGKKIDLITGDGHYYGFKGIPYAAPPVGPLRFKPPQPAIPWNEVLDATEHRSVCHQFSVFTYTVINGSEDCLFVNVYTPTLNPDHLMPVMIYIHGGAHQSGAGNSDYYSPDFLMPKGVVVVLFNHRLEVFGFLSLQNKDVPGNNGLKDQVAVFKWVQTNINQFGGDPSKVMIFGGSSAAALVGLHVISPMSKGLFHRAVVQSGSPLSGWALTPYPKERAFQVGRALGFHSDDSKELLNFFKNASKEDLIDKVTNIFTWDCIVDRLKLITFGPVVEIENGDEEHFLTMKPEEYLAKGIINDVEIMIGYNSEEGIFYGQILENEFEYANNFKSYYLLNPMAYGLNVPEQYAIADKIKKHYLGDGRAEIANLKGLTKYISWATFKYDMTHFFMSLPPNGRARYQYYFSAETERNYNTRVYGSKKIHIEGVSHGDELAYIFHQEAFNAPAVNKSALSWIVIQRVCDMWTNFTKYGNPTPPEVERTWNVKWKPWTLTNQDYMDIGRSLTPQTHLDAEEVQFWTDIYLESQEMIDKRRAKASEKYFFYDMIKLISDFFGWIPIDMITYFIH